MKQKTKTPELVAVLDESMFNTPFAKDMMEAMKEQEGNIDTVIDALRHLIKTTHLSYTGGLAALCQILATTIYAGHQQFTGETGMRDTSIKDAEQYIMAGVGEMVATIIVALALAEAEAAKQEGKVQ